MFICSMPSMPSAFYKHFFRLDIISISSRSFFPPGTVTSPRGGGTVSKGEFLVLLTNTEIKSPMSKGSDDNTIK